MSFVEDRKADVKQLKRLTKHKYHVYKAGRELKLPRGQLLKHDISKLKPEIWRAYADYWYTQRGVRGLKDPDVKKRFKEAVRKHFKAEKHHATRVGLPKPLEYRMESLADQYSAARIRSKKKDFPRFSKWLEQKHWFPIKEEIKQEARERLKRANQEQWVKKVTSKSTFPPKSIFNKDAKTIAEVMASKEVSPKGIGSAIKMVQFYINRAGKKLSPERRAELENAKKLLRGMKKQASFKDEINKLALKFKID